MNVPVSTNESALDVRSAKVVHELIVDRAPNCCAFDRQGQNLYLGCEDNFIRQWQIPTTESLKLEGHTSWVRGFLFPFAEDQFISGGYDGHLIWWTRERTRFQVAKRIAAHQGWIRSIALTPDGNSIVSAGNDRIVKLWSAVDGQLLHEFKGHEQSICSLAVHPSGEEVASADLAGNIRVWNLVTRQFVRQIDATSTSFSNKSNRGTSGGLRGLVFSADGTRLCGSGTVAGGDPLGQAVNPGGIVFDWTSGERLTLLRGRGNEQGVAWSIAYHPRLNLVIAISGGMSAKHFYFWKPTSEQPEHVIELPSPGRSLSLHPDGASLAVALHDGKVQIYSLADNSSQRTTRKE